ncbi:MAG: histidine kinase [Bacteroidetes bacterium HGW-Bacteroidetes-11]|nr:MAG: histidine kinase [Bacteroidetes bacterium HGW-Bacteroidetes-11]
MRLMAITANHIFLRSIFAASLFILIFISGITYRNTASLTESMEWVVQSYKFQTEVEQLFSLLKDAENSQRGFLIAGDSAFLEKYFESRKSVVKSFAKLDSLQTGNPQQQKNLKFLNQLIDLRLQQYDLSLKYSSDLFLNQEELTANMRKGSEITSLIDKQIDKIIDLESSNLKERQEKYEFKSFFVPWFTLFIMLFSLFVFVLAYVKINSDLEEQKRSNKKLLISTESMKHAEAIGEFFITQWDLKTNRYIFSDNLYRLLGCEPQSFKATAENFLKFVHPDDKHIVSNGTGSTRQSSMVFPRTYRIIRKDGGVRYLKSMGKIITDSKGNLTHVSVAKDITQFQLSNMALEKRNQELLQSISELESFNHVASHDLQEPLRKIQTFISRISEKDQLIMDENSKEYFARIQASVSRMRTLIDDLLLYSRTTKTDKEFERTDLNLLLENTLQELSQQIEEKNAVIHSENLPALKVIPFQIQQLFYNLISNSLKYSKPGLAPIIKIECRKIETYENPELFSDSGKEYYKISVSDNGMGFEQEYANKVFELFNRLHIKGDYPGTGIGLSICKKIAENHSGVITAESKPNEGAVFLVFLPD